jgi:hypothetical protein
MKELVGIKSAQPQIQPQPQPHLGQPTLGQSIIQGMAFGGGSGIAHAFIGRLFNGSSNNKLDNKKIEYENCLEITKKNYEACEHLNV